MLQLDALRKLKLDAALWDAKSGKSADPILPC
jgi:hypothetical protein